MLYVAGNHEHYDERIGHLHEKLWIHGHIHETRDYQIGRTRILNNALGYQTAQDPERTGFRADLVVEL